jgi:hypothetical protein
LGAGHIGDAFVALAEAVRFTRDRVVDRTDYEEDEPPAPSDDEDSGYLSE